MSELFDPLFGDPEVTAVFGDLGRIQAMLDVEAALATALARVGVVPETAVDPIRQAARAELYDAEGIGAGAARAGNVVIPLVSALTERVERTDPEAARFVHWGATSQDVQDTAMVLGLRAAVPHIVANLRAAADRAADLARRHADTPMAGRTWLQHATPITFGLKAAGWCRGLDRVADRVDEALRRASVLQLGGAAGTLAAFGPDALAVADALGRILGLEVPELSWHTHRDRIVDLGAALGLVIGELGKIGRDLSLLAQTEVAEAHEANPGGSSAMPQKRNPVAASVALAAAARAPGLVATLFGAMAQEQERGLGGWQAEWETLPELARLAGGAARAVSTALAGLVVDERRMAANLGLTGGLIAAESLALALGATLGKRRAHAVVEAAAGRARTERRTLAEVAAADPAIRERLDEKEIAAAVDPAGQVGAARALVERALAARRARG
jgi:3-carboxy-cis,cis-muconate cycloisomerase